MDEVGPRDHGVCGLRLTGMHIDFGMFSRTSGIPWVPAIDINDIIMRSLQLRLREIREKILVTAVTINDDDLLAAVPAHFVGGFLQQIKLHVHAVGNRSGFMPRLSDLAEIISRKNDGIFVCGGMFGGIAK